MSSQDNRPSQKTSNPTVVGHVKHNAAETGDKDFKIGIFTMFKKNPLINL